MARSKAAGEAKEIGRLADPNEAAARVAALGACWKRGRSHGALRAIEALDAQAQLDGFSKVYGGVSAERGGVASLGCTIPDGFAQVPRACDEKLFDRLEATGLGCPCFHCSQFSSLDHVFLR